jgi:hypothetical protein
MYDLASLESQEHRGLKQGYEIFRESPIKSEVLG